jgi:hypothetical protein
MDSNTYHIKMAVLEELRHTLKVKRINDELLEHLASTLGWLLRYAEKTISNCLRRIRLYGIR